jgi:homogentisate 1,2-dioxygenase
MIDRMQQGRVPPKPHIVHEVEGQLTYEECFTRQGFEGAYSILYHRAPPTRTVEWKASTRGWKPPVVAPPELLSRRHFLGPKLPAGGTMLDARVPIFTSADVTILLARPTESDDVYLANGDGDELHFIHEGRGRLDTMFGVLPFQAGDYVHLPRSTIHRWHWDAPGLVFTTEGHGFVDVPRNFRNPSGQLRMDAPYSHRDFGRPEWPENGLDRAMQDGPRTVVAKKHGRFTEYTLAHNPLDIVGWDGFVWPFTFAIEKYQPKTGLVHLPPTIHGTFAGNGFLVCSFVPRLTDTHEQAIPCPYPHSSVDCDEVIFYVRGNFTSRKGVGPGSLSFHPSGVVHGPHPGSYEASIGSKRTDEMAVMLDTYMPLQITTAALALEDRNYMASWNPPG